MIWNFIRDFIVQNITGGYDSNAQGYFAGIGRLWSITNTGSVEDAFDANTIDLFYKIDDGIEGSVGYLTFGDWLATTLTIICMCLIVAFAIWLVIWVFKMVAHAFLLRR